MLYSQCCNIAKVNLIKNVKHKSTLTHTDTHLIDDVGDDGNSTKDIFTNDRNIGMQTILLRKVFCQLETIYKTFRREVHVNAFIGVTHNERLSKQTFQVTVMFNFVRVLLLVCFFKIITKFMMPKMVKVTACKTTDVYIQAFRTRYFA